MTRSMTRRTALIRSAPRMVPHIAPFALVALSVLLPAVASASPIGGAATMPWESPLTVVGASLTGPTARLLGIIAVAIACITWKVTDSERGVRRLGNAVVAFAVTVGAPVIIAAIGAGFSGATL